MKACMFKVLSKPPLHILMQQCIVIDVMSNLSTFANFNDGLHGLFFMPFITSWTFLVQSLTAMGKAGVQNILKDETVVPSSEVGSLSVEAGMQFKSKFRQFSFTL